MTTHWHIAQLNIATAMYDIDDANMAGFVNELDRINALADGAPGFVWRLQSDSGNATDVDVGDDPRLLVNMSVWEDIPALFEFAYKSAHREIVAQRREWFARPDGAYQVLWWIPVGHTPTIEEAMDRLALLEAKGPHAEAFTFKVTFAAPHADVTPGAFDPAAYCSGWE